MQDKLNKIVQADCLEYLRELPNECCEAVIFDEPYGILTGHKIEAGYNLDIAKQVRIEVMRVLKRDGWFVWFGAFPSAWEFGRITMEVGFKPWQACNEIVWCKRSPSWCVPKVLKIHENIFVFQKGNPQIYENKAPYEDILVDNAFHGIASFSALKSYIASLKWQINNPLKSLPIKIPSKAQNDNFFCKTIAHSNYKNEIKLASIWSFCKENKLYCGTHNIKHPSVKPTMLLNRLIRLFTKEGDTVLDPFVGSGTIALASIQTNRNFLACERDEGYVKIANDRLNNWESDLLRQKEWLEKRGVNDFFDDIEMPKTEQQETLI